MNVVFETEKYFRLRYLVMLILGLDKAARFRSSDSLFYNGEWRRRGVYSGMCANETVMSLSYELGS